MSRYAHRLLFAVLMAAAPAATQAWPEKPIRFISSNAPGQGTDLIQRSVADRLSRALGQSVIVENMPGAGAISATVATARATPDGYTLGLGALTNMVLNRYLYKSLPYDPDKDVVPVGWLYDSGAFVIAVHPDVAAKNFAELISLAKTSPGRFSIGAFVSLPSNVAAYLNSVAGTDIVVVSYKNIANMVQDLLAGRVQIGLSSMQPFEPHRKAGKLRYVGVTAIQRFPTLPDVPTVAESYPGFKAFGWGMLIAPVGTPSSVIQRLNRELAPIVTDAAYVKQLLDSGFTVKGAGTPESLAEFIRSEREYWGKVAKAVNMIAQ